MLSHEDVMGLHEEATEPRVWDLVTQKLPHSVVHGPAPPSPWDAPLSHLLCDTGPLLFLSGPQVPSLPMGWEKGWPWTSLSFHGSDISGHRPTRNPLSGKCGAEDPSSGSCPHWLQSSHLLNSQCPQRTPCEEILAVTAKRQSLTT